jgi:hypothetical protein
VKYEKEQDEDEDEKGCCCNIMNENLGGCCFETLNEHFHVALLALRIVLKSG